MTLLTLLILASITFFTRYFFLHPSLPLTLNKSMQRLLSYSAPAILTAIWAPIIAIRNDQLVVSAIDPYVLGITVAIFLAFKFNQIYITSIGGGLVFVLAQQLLI
jgi:branched-subunit amino acid transport protein